MIDLFDQICVQLRRQFMSKFELIRIILNMLFAFSIQELQSNTSELRIRSSRVPNRLRFAIFQIVLLEKRNLE